MNLKFNSKFLCLVFLISLSIFDFKNIYSSDLNISTPEIITPSIDANLNDAPVDNITLGDIDLNELEKTEKAENDLLRGPIDEELIEKVLEVAEKINAPIWHLTNPPKGRDTLYLIPQRLTALEYGGLVFNAFFNYTHAMDFSPNSVLKLDENKEALDAVVSLLNTLVTSHETSGLIPLFKKLTIQERKAGILIQGGIIVSAFTFQINTSLQFAERNFWLSPKDQAESRRMFASSDSSFDENEMWRWNFGLGDTRLKAGVNAINTSSVQLDLGFEGIIPTSKISSNPSLKEFNIDFDNFEECLPNVLRNIRDNLVTPQLGNNGHFGLGCYAETKVDLFHDTMHLWSRLAFDNLFEANEDRLILSKQTIPAPGSSDEALQNFILNVLLPVQEGIYGPATDFIKQYLFPPAYKVTIKPGNILNFITELSFDLSKKWILGIGYDYYQQQREDFIKILNSKVDRSTLKINDAEQPSSSQSKIFAEINYLKKQRNWNLNFGLGGDYTISSENMGRDWTFFLRIGGVF